LDYNFSIKSGDSNSINESFLNVIVGDFWPKMKQGKHKENLIVAPAKNDAG